MKILKNEPVLTGVFLVILLNILVHFNAIEFSSDDLSLLNAGVALVLGGLVRSQVTPD